MFSSHLLFRTPFWLWQETMRWWGYGTWRKRNGCVNLRLTKPGRLIVVYHVHLEVMRCRCFQCINLSGDAFLKTQYWLCEENCACLSYRWALWNLLIFWYWWLWQLILVFVIFVITEWKQLTVSSWKITVWWWRFQMMDSSKCGNSIWKRQVLVVSICV